MKTLRRILFWLVNLLINLDGHRFLASVVKKNQVICNGGLHASRFVIVPASCIFSLGTDFTIDITSATEDYKQQYYKFNYTIHPRYQLSQDLRFNIALIFVPELKIFSTCPYIYSSNSVMKLGLTENTVDKKLDNTENPCKNKVTLPGLGSPYILCTNIVYSSSTLYQVRFGFITVSYQGNKWGLVGLAAPPIYFDKGNSHQALVIQLNLKYFSSWIYDQELRFFKSNNLIFHFGKILHNSFKY